MSQETVALQYLKLDLADVAGTVQVTDETLRKYYDETAADRNAVPMGGLAEVLSKYDGGLKAIIAAERRAKKVAAGQHIASSPADPRPRLRNARARDLSEFAGAGEEFVLLVARRDPDGNVAIVGAVEADAAMTEKALRKTAV